MTRSNRITNRVAVLLLLLVAAGCGGRKGRSDAPEPIPECEAYGHALSACLHRDIAFATQAAAIPKSDDERTRITTVCRENLRRLQIACR